MIRVNRIILVFVLVTLTIAQPQAKAVRNLSASPAAPDLIVTKVSRPDHHTLKVRVKNQGNGAAASCYMALILKLYNGFGSETRVLSPKVPALAPGQETEQEVKTEINLYNFDYEAIADRTNTVIESNEANNRLKGAFSYKL
jgi:subtilase family serine protease